jgi:asparagine synthase (glutamine-hydrolysing)
MLIVDAGGLRIRAYWKFERGPQVRHRTREDYVRHFGDIFRTAVADRLPAGPVGLALTAGMDSSSIAAVAADLMRDSGFGISAFHHTTTSLIPEDDEKLLAQETADRFGIDLLCVDVATSPLFAAASDPALRTPQPLMAPQLDVHRRSMDAMQRSGARVFLSGYMGDAAFTNDTAHYTNLLRRGRLLAFAREAAHHWRVNRSPRGLGLRTLVRRQPPAPPWRPRMPDWIACSAAEARRLEAVWEEFWRLHQDARTLSDQLRLPWIGRQFAALEALSAPLVWNYPFLDLRLLAFLSGIPAGLLVDKRILRSAMHGQLPPSVLARPKRGVPGDVVRTMVTSGILAFNLESIPLPPMVARERFHAGWQRFRDGEGADATWQSGLMMQPVALGYWLANNRSRQRKDRHGATPAAACPLQ